MTIINTRLENARCLAADTGGQQRFADRLNMSRQQASHIIGKNPHKGIGHTMARRIEQMFDVPVGWLDVDHSTPSVVNEDTVDVPLLSSSASAGTDALPSPDSEVVRRIVISKRWIRLNVQATAFEHLGLLTAMGDSMEPTFGDGSILMVDRGVTTVNTDGIYVLCKADALFVKRVQRQLDGSITLRSDNSNYEPTNLTSDELKHVLVLGRVLVAWVGKKL
jgi:SOS-response transcriptional repressor LexA